MNEPTSSPTFPESWPRHLRPWTREEDKRLLSFGVLWQDHPAVRQLALEFGRSSTEVWRRRRFLLRSPLRVPTGLTIPEQ